MTFTDQAEKYNSNNPTKYVMCSLKDNGTSFSYQTTPRHPSEGKDPSERYLGLNIKSEVSPENMEKLLSFLSLSQSPVCQGSHMEIFTPNCNHNLTVGREYVPEFNMNDYNFHLKMSREDRECAKSQEFSSWISWAMNDFFGIKVKLSYDKIFHSLKGTGTRNSEGVVGLCSAYSQGNSPYNLNAHIFQSPLELKTTDLVKTIFDPRGISSHSLSNIIHLLASADGEGLRIQNDGSFFEFNFDTGFVNPETRKKYTDSMFDIYKQITDTSPKPEFKTQNAFVDIKD